MGVKTLTTYVDSDGASGAWDGTFVLENTRLVVDGGGLRCHLLTVCGPGRGQGDVRCGGQYSDFYHFTCRFVTDLLQRGVRPVVVLDGLDVDQKLDELIRRSQGQAEAMKKVSQCSPRQQAIAQGKTMKPIWMHSVFLEALTDCGVPVIRTNREADSAIAAIASHYNCPVLATDSDFFIYDIPGGLVHLPKINYQSPCTGPVPLFRKSLFIKTLARVRALRGYTEERIGEVLPLAATLCGNDFVARDKVEHLYRGITRPRILIVRVLLWLLQTLCVQSLEDGARMVCARLPQEPEVVKNIKYSLDMYQQDAPQCAAVANRCLSPEFLPASFSMEDIKPKEERAAEQLPQHPGWLMDAFHLGFVCATPLFGCLLKFLRIGIHLDSPKHASINELDRPLRAILLAIFQSTTAVVDEIMRRPGSTCVDKVTLQAAREVPEYGAVPSLLQVDELSSEERRRFFLLACDSWTDRVKELKPASQFLVASLRYLWKQMLANSHTMPAISPRHVAVLLVGIVDGCDGDCETQVQDVDKVIASQKQHLQSWCAEPAAGEPADRGRRQEVYPTPHYQGHVSCETIHVFNGWQRVLLAMAEVNWALNRPMPVLYTHRLYDGGRNFEMCEKYYDAPVEDILIAVNSAHHRVAQELWEAVVEGKDTWTQPTPGTGSI